MTQSHSAAGPASGYQYQADYCLLELIKHAGPGRAISLELHDDVAWEDAYSPLERLQVKHTVHTTGGLGDRSTGIWKTLKVWMDAGGAADEDGPLLVLVTSGTAQPGSAAYFLRSGSRDPGAAAEALRAAAGDAQSAGAKQTKASRDKFARMSGTDQNTFISRIVVVDLQPTVAEIDATVREHLYTHLPQDPNKADDFMHRLWGWWRERVVEMLSARYRPQDALRTKVDSADYKSQLLRLNADFSEHGLPSYDEFDVEMDDPVLEGLDEKRFVQQLTLVRAHSMAIRKAIVDYYRATASETEWFKGDYLQTDDVIRYERRLRDAWEVAYSNMLTDLGDDASEDEQIAAGRSLLAETLEKIPLRIRTQVDQDFYYRGKHHMLAERDEVGWHPAFKANVAAMLLPNKTAS